MMTALMLSTIADMVPNNLRGLSVSLLGLTSTLIGVVLGPFLVASVTEHLLHDANRVGFAIALVAAPALLIASGLYALALTGLRRSASRSAEPGPMLFAGSPP
jgi:MFS family permease